MRLGSSLYHARKKSGLSQEDVAGKLKSVPVDCDEIQAARQIGISFGD